MLPILRAFAWLRWRMLINAIERTGARDTLERFSLAIEQVGPIILLLLLVPTALGLGAAGAVAGYALGRGESTIVFEVLRYLLLGTTAMCIVGPLLMPGAGRTNAVRLLLLPIPRRVLYLAQAPGSLVEPWVLIAWPVALGVPLGLLAAGAFAAAGLALVAGIGLVVVFTGLTELATLLLQLVARDRRRGELVALLLILILPMLPMIPGLLIRNEQRENRASGRIQRDSDVPRFLRDAGWFVQFTPSDLFAATVRRSAAGDTGPAALRVVPLAAIAVGLHGLAFVVFGRLLDSPGSTGGRRRGGAAAAPWRTLPGLSLPASAVALAQIRLGLRTPRGRSILLSPLLVFAIFAAILWRSAGSSPLPFSSGLGLAAFCSAVCVVSILPFAMNQFAIDGAGLTLVFLSPVRDSELLLGKAIGNGVIAGGPALLCVAIAAAVFPEGSPALWIALPFGLASTYILATPAAAALSLAFPRAVDLNSVGRGSNAQGLAGFIGLLAFVACGVPAIVLTFVLDRLLERPVLVPIALAAWCLISLGLAYLLFKPVRVLLEKRKENLGMV